MEIYTIGLTKTTAGNFFERLKTAGIRRLLDVRLAAAAEVILSVGLTRLFMSTDDHARLHWLQVNNIHVADDPCWQLG